MPVTGRYIERNIGGESVRAFVPDRLPRVDSLGLTTADWELFGNAKLALGRLDSIATLLPDPSLFIYFYIRKEALLSSQIEGTQSSLSDLLLFESAEEPGVPLADVREVSNYIGAMYHGLSRIREDRFPLVGRLIKELHGKLLDKSRGSEKNPAEYRISQNWIGGSRPGNARFVPPPPELVGECMSELEKFLHDQPARTPALLKAALAHVQFETIHPFLDGNGRVGRLLITLILCSENVLQEATLYLSLYLKQNRDEYYELLQRVRTEGAWLDWIRFFLRGVEQTAIQATNTATRVLKLFETDQKKIDRLERGSVMAHRVHTHLREHAIMASVPKAARSLDVSIPSVRSAIERLTQLGIVQQLGERKWGRAYAYKKYLAILSEGTEPLLKVTSNLLH